MRPFAPGTKPEPSDSSYSISMRTYLAFGVLGVSLLGGCASRHLVLATEQEQVNIETAAHEQVAVAEKLPLDADSIYPALERFLLAHPDIYGWAFVIDPSYAGKPLAPYVYRQGSQIIRTDLAKATRASLRRTGMLTEEESRAWRNRPAEAYSYSTQSWFIQPLSEHKAVWSEPYFAAGAKEPEMATFSIPVTKRGRVIGVLAADCELNRAIKNVPAP